MAWAPLQLGGLGGGCYVSAHHYKTKEWPTRNSYAPGVKNIQHTPLVNPDKVFMRPLHIKLGLRKNFVKAMVKHISNGFKFLCKKFPKLSQAKLKERIFVDPQIWKVFEDPEFEKTLNTLELRAWHLNGFAPIFWEISSQIRIKKVLQNCLRHTKRWGVACPQRCIFFIHTLSFSLKILEQLVMSRVKNFTKISKLWKKGTKEFGMKV